MGRALLVLANDHFRQKAVHWIMVAPKDTRVTFQGPKRSIPQNALFWQRLTEVSEQLTWHSMKLSPDDWRLMFLAALGGEMRIVPNLAGNGFVDLGRSSSRLDKEEFGELLSLIEVFAAEHGVELSDLTQSAAAAEPGSPNKRPVAADA